MCGFKDDEFIPMIPDTVPEYTVSLLGQVRDYNHDLTNVPAMWRRTKGRGAKVVVLDTGMPKHRDVTVTGAKSFIPGYLEDGNGHGCIEGDTIVFTDKYGFTTIKEVYDREQGDELTQTFSDGVTATTKNVVGGSMHTLTLVNYSQAITSSIVAVHKVPVSGTVVKIVLDDGTTFRLTPWHKLPVIRKDLGEHSHFEKVRADALTKGMLMPYACTTSYTGGKTQYLDGYAHPRCTKCGHALKYEWRTGSRANCKCTECGNREFKAVAKKFEVTEGLAYFMGLITADGYVRSESGVGHDHPVRITNTHLELLEGLNRDIESAGFQPGHIHEINNNRDGRAGAILKTYEWSVSNKDLWTCMRNAGFGSDKTANAFIPDVIIKSRQDVIYSYLAGLIDGDGSITKDDGKLRVTTVSPRLAEDIKHIFTLLGMPTIVHKYKNFSFGSKHENKDFPILNPTSRRIAYGIMIRLRHSDKKENASKYFYKERRRRGRTIVSVTSEHADENYYDFTVDHQEHNYWANGYFFSNTGAGSLIAGVGSNGMGILGVAPECDDYYGAVLNASGAGPLRAVADGIRWAVDEVGADVVNLSLGTPAVYGCDPGLQKACEYAYDNGVTLVAAAGNDGGKVNWPAALPQVIAVAAVDRRLRKADFSSYGPEVEFSAGGVEVMMAYRNNGYASMSGTSFSAPVISGICALIVAEHRSRGVKLSPEEVRAHLKSIAYDIGPEGRDDFTGWGIPVFTRDTESATGRPGKPKVLSWFGRIIESLKWW